MAHPYHHAISSEKQYGGSLYDYLAIHSWFDASKAHFADFRHRALRHHSLGVEMVEQVFNQTKIAHDGLLTNSSNREVAIRQIGAQHVREDCGDVMCPSHWMMHLKLVDWMRGIRNVSVDEHCDFSVNKWGGVAEDYEAIHKWFCGPVLQHESEQFRALLYHSQGIFTAEEVFGPIVANSNGRIIPVRFIAEEHVKLAVGRIPTAFEWLKEIQARPWMRRVGVKLDSQLVLADKD